jgi:hypothetical protein
MSCSRPPSTTRRSTPTIRSRSTTGVSRRASALRRRKDTASPTARRASASPGSRSPKSPCSGQRSSGRPARSPGHLQASRPESVCGIERARSS